MEIKKDTVCEDTLYLMREYYHLNTEPLFSVLAKDCVWLSVGNLTVFGADAIKAQFKNGFIMPPFELEEPHFRQIETGNENQLMVLGEYMLYASKNAENICSAKQRLTFCYRQESEGFRMYHMHVSNEYNELVGEEIFPVQISRQTYTKIHPAFELTYPMSSLVQQYQRYLLTDSKVQMTLLHYDISQII